ncbi:MAG: hypothetical protein JOS17DRAFT_747407 [Linnemannia elongata]|nr:MAG: hypothetical protein JOS17DRAFT_747407 [Linnemannia elongata]
MIGQWRPTSRFELSLLCSRLNSTRLDLIAACLFSHSYSFVRTSFLALIILSSSSFHTRLLLGPTFRLCYLFSCISWFLFVRSGCSCTKQTSYCRLLSYLDMLFFLTACASTSMYILLFPCGPPLPESLFVFLTVPGPWLLVVGPLEHF